MRRIEYANIPANPSKFPTPPTVGRRTPRAGRFPPADGGGVEYPAPP
jgi:hypothetical protein